MAKVLLAIVAAIAALVVAPAIHADPYPGCPWISGVPGNVCSNNPPVPGLTPGFSMQDDVPYTWGPDGIYTPCIASRGCQS